MSAVKMAVQSEPAAVQSEDTRVISSMMLLPGFHSTLRTMRVSLGTRAALEALELVEALAPRTRHTCRTLARIDNARGAPTAAA